MRCLLYFMVAWPLLLLLLFSAWMILYGFITGDLEAFELAAMVVFGSPITYVALAIPALILSVAYFFLRRRLSSPDNEFAAPAFYLSVGAGVLVGLLIGTTDGNVSVGVGAGILLILATFACVLLIERPWHWR